MIQQQSKEDETLKSLSNSQKDGVRAARNRVDEYPECLTLIDDKLHCVFCNKVISPHRSHCIAHMKTHEHIKNSSISNKRVKYQNAPFVDYTVTSETTSMGRKLEPFQLEIFFAKHEFSATHLLCCSDSESFTMKELLSMADHECIDMWDNLRLGYTETKGLPALRQQCSLLYEGFNAENILCFAGAEEGVFCTLQTILTSLPEDVTLSNSFKTKHNHAIIVTPCYQSLLSIPASLSSSITTVPLVLVPLPNSNDPNNETTSLQWQLNLTAIRETIKPGHTKLVVINFPHNPTGAIITLAEQQELVNMAREHDLWIFSDEVYRGFENVSSNKDSPQQAFDDSKSLCTLYPKAISLGAMSKVYGMPGVRVGWVACQDRQLLARISESKHYLSICNSAPSEILALIALRARDKILARNKSIVQHNLALVEAFLSRHPNDFSWVPPRGGCCGFMRYHKASSTKTLDAITKTLVNRFGVLILPGDNFPLHIRTLPTDGVHNESNNADSNASLIPLESCAVVEQDSNPGDSPKLVEVSNPSEGIESFFRVGLGRANFGEALKAFENALPFLDED